MRWTFTEEAWRAQIIARVIGVVARLGYIQTPFARAVERAGNSAAKQRVLDSKRDFDIRVNEPVALVDLAARKTVA